MSQSLASIIALGFLNVVLDYPRQAVVEFVNTDRGFTFDALVPGRGLILIHVQDDGTGFVYDEAHGVRHDMPEASPELHEMGVA